ncbi:MAG: KH domain-containing protein [Anaerolineae bacterium]
MKDLVEFMATSIVENSEAVSVQEVRRAGTMVLKLSVDPDDMGRVIGKQGRVANTMRTLLRVAAVKEGKRASLEIV